MNIAQINLLADLPGMHGDIGAGWWIVMMIGMVLFWGAIILGIVWLIRGGTWGGSAPRETHVNKETPVEILERRFAEGSISPEDYRARREVLVNGAAHRNAAAEDELLTTSRAAGGID